MVTMVQTAEVSQAALLEIRKTGSSIDGKQGHVLDGVREGLDMLANKAPTEGAFSFSSANRATAVARRSHKKS